MTTTELTTDIIGKFFTIGGILQREGNRLLAPFGVNQQQFSLLFEIGHAGGVRQKDIINRLMLEKAHVSKAVKKLQAMELITIERRKEDRRSAWITVTDRGVELLEQAKDQFEKWNCHWFAALEEQRLQEILKSLCEIETAFVKQMQEE